VDLEAAFVLAALIEQPLDPQDRRDTFDNNILMLSTQIDICVIIFIIRCSEVPEFIQLYVVVIGVK